MALQTNVRPEDKPKLIVMTIATVGCLVFVFSRLLHGAPPAQAETVPPPSASAPAASAASGAPVAGRQVASSSPKVGDVQSLNQDESAPILLTSDPFRPVTGTESKSAPSAQVASAPTNKPVKEARRVTQGEFGGGLSVLPPMKVSVPSQPAQEIATEISLKGTIEQEKSMAILKMGDKTFYLTEGERLPGGIVVEKVTVEGVVLRSGNRRTSLTPGQSLKPNTSLLSARGGIQDSF